MALGNIANFTSIDDLSQMGSPIHRIHPSCKVIVCTIFITIVMSFSSDKISPLMPFFLYPIVIASLGKIPLGKIIKMVLPALPFILLVAIFNPLFDRKPVFYLGSFTVTHGMLSFLSIIMRSFLTLFSVLLLVATTGIYNIGYVLQSFKLPSIFVTQLVFLHRYIFVLTEETITMKRAVLSRSPYGKHPDLITFGHMISSLITRSIDTSTRIYTAMLARGFNGKIELQKKFVMAKKEIAFSIAWIVFFISARVWNIPEALGTFVLGLTK